eukprot:COSAG02_NODE_1965_length_10236_cov_4.020907_7_plen_49_part_00
MSVPPQLQPLVQVLPGLGTEAVRLALRSAALHLQVCGANEPVCSVASE